MSTAAPCRRLHEALSQCRRRNGGDRSSAWGAIECKHLNRALAECLVSEACPQELEAVKVLCDSGGTHLKRTQCKQAQASLSICLSSLQEPDTPPP